MKRWIIGVMLTLCLTGAKGQGTIRGVVCGADSSLLVGARMELCRPADDKIIMSTLSDKDGKYRFENIDKGSYAVRATALGCPPVRKSVIVWGTSEIIVDFKINDRVVLDEVKVVSNGINVRGDTTSYIVRHFTTGTERSLGDILGRLPNVRIDEDSKTITANGKRVSRILMEGQDLFQGNTVIPTDNLSAGGVSQIDVIENYSEYSIYDGFKTTNETVINVGVNDKMRSRLKGDLDMAGGVLNKYQARNAALYIGKKQMFSGIMAANNIGMRHLTFRDIMQFSGGMQNLLSGDDPMEKAKALMETYAPFMNDRKDTERRESNFASLNYMANPSSKLRLSVSGIYGYDHHISRNERDYAYLSGLQYSDASAEKGRQHELLSQAKVVYAPSRDMNMVWDGKFLFSSRNTRSDHTLYENILNYNRKPGMTNAETSLLLVKRMGKNTLNLLADYRKSDTHDDALFVAAQPYYAARFHLSDAYDYASERMRETGAAQLFYLHRLNDAYYLRLAFKGMLERQTLCSQLHQTMVSEQFDNDATIDYSGCYADAMLGKDRSRLRFAVRLRYLLQHARTNLARDFADRTCRLVSPRLQADYDLSAFHHLSLNYEYGIKLHPITALLGDSYYLESYNNVMSSSVSRFFAKVHKASVLQLLILQYIGLSMMNMVSFETSRHDVAENNRQETYTSLVEKRLSPARSQLSWLSQVEYRFISLPLNVKATINYVHARVPVFHDDALYRAQSGTMALMLQLSTYFKKGLNGDLRWMIDRNVYHGTPIRNRMTNQDLRGKLMWKAARFYAHVEARYHRYGLNQNHDENVFYGFEVRYDASKRLGLRLYGSDVMHLAERKRETGRIDSYYSMNSRVWYMPGYVMAGLTLKY